ncbi:MAG: orotidine-5'-phosphate decarboxylase [Kiritimatiellia bacterium]
MTYLEKLSSRIRSAQSNLCVGIDPRADLIDGDLEGFVRRVVEEAAPFAAAFKPNIAYFEAFGAKGVQVLEDTLKSVPREIPVVLDVKRSDIPETMKYYAEAYFGQWGVDAVTLNGLMGCDSIEPFLTAPEHGVYLLAVTSNPGAADIELQKVGERYVFELMQDYAEKSANLPGQVGLVMGLTNVSDDVLSKVRDLPLLIPGLGAQGGDLSRLDMSSRAAPNLINASRSILYGKEGTVASRAEAARDKIREALQGE